MHRPIPPEPSPGRFSYRRFFAWLLHVAGDPYADEVKARKRELFAGLEGTVVEVGPGTGVNLAYYPPGLRRLLVVEPNPFMHPYLREAAREHDVDVEFRDGTAESMDVRGGSVDAVVSTLVLCSVDEVDAALAEILRVLEPGGRFLFVEHVAARRGGWLRRLQRFIRPLWRRLGDGCRPDRETWTALERAGFESLHYERFDADTLALVRPHIAGVGVKPGQAPEPPA